MSLLCTGCPTNRQLARVVANFGDRDLGTDASVLAVLTSREILGIRGLPSPDLVTEELQGCEGSTS